MAKGYRFSGTYIKKKERSLTAVLLLGIGIPWAVAGIMFWAGMLVWVDPPTAYAVVLIAMVAAPIVTVVVVVTIAAIMGGRALSRTGWVAGLLFSLWFFVGLALVLGGVLGWIVYAAGFAVLIGLFYLMGYRRGVAMWIGGTRWLPVLKRFQRSPEEGEEETSKLDDLGRPLSWLPWAKDAAQQVCAGQDVRALAESATAGAGTTPAERAARYAAASTVPYLVWHRLTGDLDREHHDDLPGGAGRLFTPLYLQHGRTASSVTGVRRLCRLSHRAMARTDLTDDDTMNLAHLDRDGYAARLARRRGPERADVIRGCLDEAAALLTQRDVVLEVAAEARR